MNTNAHAADHRSQAITRPEATNHQTTWTHDELVFVDEFSDDRDEDLALALGRSLYAIRSIRAHLAERLQGSRDKRATQRPEVTITDWAAWEASFE